MNALWRKSFFCKPYTGDRADALRFKDEFEEAAALKNADSDYTMQDVLRGFDLPLAPPPFHGALAAGVTDGVDDDADLIQARLGYFSLDAEHTAKVGHPVWNRSVTLKDGWKG